MQNTSLMTHLIPVNNEVLICQFANNLPIWKTAIKHFTSVQVFHILKRFETVACINIKKT